MCLTRWLDINWFSKAEQFQLIMFSLETLVKIHEEIDPKMEKVDLTIFLKENVLIFFAHLKFFLPFTLLYNIFL